MSIVRDILTFQVGGRGTFVEPTLRAGGVEFLTPRDTLLASSDNLRR